MNTITGTYLLNTVTGSALLNTVTGTALLNTVTGTALLNTVKGTYFLNTGRVIAFLRVLSSILMKRLFKNKYLDFKCAVHIRPVLLKAQINTLLYGQIYVCTDKAQLEAFYIFVTICALK